MTELLERRAMWDICTIIFVVGAICGLLIWMFGRDREGEMGREVSRLVEANKHHAPILYLRSFASNTLQLADIKNDFMGKPIAHTPATWKDAGHMVTPYLQVIAPIEELSSPESTWRLKPWAPSRPKSVAVNNDAWQQRIVELLTSAPLVVIQMDISAGLAWELQQAVRLVFPTKMLLVLPPTQGEYDQIRAGTEGFFPNPFPAELPASRLMTFNSNWQPCPLPIGSLFLWQTLELVFLQNGYEAPPWRRIYGMSPRV